jgi:hypothetical protein
LHLYHDQFGHFPSNGGYGGEAGLDLETGGLRWGVGDPAASPENQPGPWSYSVLPYAEQDNVYYQKDYGTGLKIFACRSRRNGTAQVNPGTDPVNSGWSFETGGLNPWTKTDYAANNDVIVNRGGTLLAITDITDGASNTLLLGEKSFDPRNYETGTWLWDEPIACGGNGGNARNGTAVAKDVIGVNYGNNWGSAHAVVAQFAFGDASVRGLKFNIDPGTVGALLSPAGGEPTPATD